MEAIRKIREYNYKREELKAGILHIGVGNFHRAHQEYYINRLLELGSSKDWAVCGLMLLPGDVYLYKALKAANYEYTLTVFGRDKHDELLRIGSLVELLWAGESAEEITERIKDSSIRIISLTITEGGYNIVDGKFDLNNEDVRHDLHFPSEPGTVFGFVAEGLRKRKAAGGGPLTILSCDNLQHNGDVCRKAFTAFIEAQDGELAEWVKANVSFPNSMVDRITPAVKAEDVERLNRENGTSDPAPVYCEDFIQWVIEDKFAAGRPELEKVGVQFTDDVTKWENMKLSLLNASHTMLSYPAFLCGYRKVDKALMDEDLRTLLIKFMDIDITPFVELPEGVDISEYKKNLIERFSNKAVSDQVARLCSDGLSKFPVYIVPNLGKMINFGADLSRVAFLIAAYRHYLKFKTDDNGEAFEINEPKLGHKDIKKISSNDTKSFLSLSAFEGLDLGSKEQFVKLYKKMVKDIQKQGVREVLKTVI